MYGLIVQTELQEGYSYNYSTDVPRAIKVGNVVQLSGLLMCEETADTLIATLPEGFRPSAHFNRYWVVYGSNHQEQTEVQVDGTTGKITLLSKTTSAAMYYLSLGCISFVAVC